MEKIFFYLPNIYVGTKNQYDPGGSKNKTAAAKGAATIFKD
jgi:hypothetical protein